MAKWRWRNARGDEGDYSDSPVINEMCREIMRESTPRVEAAMRKALESDEPIDLEALILSR